MFSVTRVYLINYTFFFPYTFSVRHTFLSPLNPHCHHHGHRRSAPLATSPLFAAAEALSALAPCSLSFLISTTTGILSFPPQLLDLLPQRLSSLPSSTLTADQINSKELSKKTSMSLVRNLLNKTILSKR